MRRRIPFYLLLPVIALSSAASAQSDVTPPHLQALAFSPSAVTVSASAQTVVVDLDVTDDLSGVATVLASFRSPNSTIAQAVATPLTGSLYRATITIPRYAAVGTWSLTLTLTDRVGNTAFVSTAVLQAGGFPTSLAVTSTPADISPPTPVSISFSPSTIDVSNGPQSVMVQVQVNDDLSGVFVDPTFVSAFSFVLQSPAGQQIRRSNPDFTVTGSPSASVWQIPLVIPQYSDAALWSVVSLRVADVAGNVRNFTPTTLTAAGITSKLTVTSTVSDRTAPYLLGFSLTPTVINTSLGPQTVRAKLDLLDDLSGVSYDFGTFFNRLFITSPSSQQTVAAFRTDFTRTSGTALNGRWEANLNFPRFSEAGTWNATFLRLEDATFNLRFLDRTGIATSGFSTALVVLRPSLTADGSLGTGGGTVEDQTFGARAKVVAPANVLPGATTIAIDVFNTNLGLPIPTGFQTTGSLYVNIQLTPSPTGPLPAPGLTVVLPLPSPQPAGLLQYLYKIDPSTGDLIAVHDALGAPIWGHVDTGGQTATFNGVVGFSTVVGLLPDVISVSVDVKPGGDGNPINLKSNGVTPVAVLSTASFNAADLDLSTVTFAGALAERGSMQDVNGDGRLDQVLQFSTRQLRLSSGDSEGVLEGRTLAGVRVRGVDAVRVIR